MSPAAPQAAAAAMQVREEFLRVARKELRQGCSRVAACLERLDTAQIWHRDHAIENSIGNLVLHLRGNVSQWILSGLGGAADRRQRPREFATRDPLPADELTRQLSETVDAADAVLAALPAQQLLEKRSIQVYEVTALHAVIHVLTHFAGHVGQIIWATKHMTGQDLGFYGYLNTGAATGPQDP